MKRVAVVWALFFLLGCTSACRHGAPAARFGAVPPGETEPARVLITEDTTVAVMLDPSSSDQSTELTAELGARVVRPRDGTGPGVIIVPGGGDVSFEGTRKGDGVATYNRPVAVSTAWAEALARRGAVTLAYDKRTCGPNDVPTCTKNPQHDVDKEGPAALARDVDAACAVLKTVPGFDGRIVLFAHGQAGQVALSSTCARKAVAIVLLSPIPRAVDEVLVDALRARQARTEKEAAKAKEPEGKEALLRKATELKGAAASKEASFASMRGGKFEKNARVEGATVSFWLGWIDLTKKSRDLVSAVKDRALVVTARGDLQASDRDRAAQKALPARLTVEVDADYNLLTDGALAPATVDQVGAALDTLMQGTPTS